MITFLREQGFKIFRSCGCDGGKAWLKKQEMPGIQIVLMKRGDQYEIKRSNKVINKGMSHQLESEYNKLFTHEYSENINL